MSYSKILLICSFFLLSIGAKSQSISTISEVDSLRHSHWAESQNPASIGQANYEFTAVNIHYLSENLGEFALVQEAEKTTNYGLSSLRWGNYEKVSYTGWINYNKATQQGIEWRTMSASNLLSPYTVADSIGGDVYTENYHVGGKLNYQLTQKLALGVGFDYWGGKQWKTTDPRSNNTLSNLEASTGFLYTLDTWKIGLGAYAGLNKENIYIGNEIDGHKPNYFFLKGLGLTDPNFSYTNSNYSLDFNRPFYGINFEIAREKQKQSTYLTLAYNKFKEEVLEIGHDGREPFEYNVTILEAKAIQQYVTEKGFWNIKAQARKLNGEGLERIYERQSANDDSTLKKWVLLSESTRYFSASLNTSLEASYRHEFSSHFALEPTLGYIFESQEIRYEVPNHHIEKIRQTSFARLKASWTTQKHRFSLLTSFGVNQLLSQEYQLNEDLFTVQEIYLEDLSRTALDAQQWKVEGQYEGAIHSNYQLTLHIGYQQEQTSLYPNANTLYFRTGIKF